MIVASNASILQLDVHGYEREFAPDPDDASWLNCQAVLSIDSYVTAKGRISIQTYDFVDFSSQLTTLLNERSNKKAILQNIEDTCLVMIESTSTGNATVTGKIVLVGSYETEINFRFDTDFAYLLRTLEGLNSVMQGCPVRN